MTASVFSYDASNSPSKDLLHRVGEDERAADHRDADDDGERGEQRADLAARESLQRDADHRPLTSSSVARISCARGGAEVADDVAVGEEQHAVGDRRGVRVMGDHDGGLAERVDRAAQQREDLAAGRGVEVAGRLVGEHDARPRDERPGDGDALLLAAGELGRAVARGAGVRPTLSTSSSSHAWSGLPPASLSGSTMFSAAVSIGSRLKNWKMKPMWSRRSLVSAVSSRPLMSTPATLTSPEVGWSRPARMCMSVDLPEPDGPMTAVRRPRPMSTETPRSASTAVSPSP